MMAWWGRWLKMIQNYSFFSDFVFGMETNPEFTILTIKIYEAHSMLIRTPGQIQERIQMI